MGEILPPPGGGAVFADARGADRTMRVTHHPEQDIVVLSLWLGPLCRSSFRLPAEQTDALVAALTSGSVLAGASAETSAGGSAADGQERDATASPGGDPLPAVRTGAVDQAAVALAVTGDRGARAD